MQTRAEYRKAVKRAKAPEYRERIPGGARVSRIPRRFGIRYSFAFLGRPDGRLSTKWYEKEAGRDAAFRSMQRPMPLGNTGRTYNLYSVLEKVNR